MALLYSFAIWTTLIQGALLPFLLILTGRYMFTSMGTSAAKTQARRADRQSNLPKEKIAPLNCPECGAGLPLEAGQLTCTHCGHVTAEPPDYAEVFKLRRAALAQLNSASRYLVRARRLSSPLVKYGLVALGLWMCAAPLILLVASGEDHRYDPLFGRLGVLAMPMLMGFLLWILVIFFTALMITRVRRILPSISDNSQIGAIEETVCPTCGGALVFHRGELSTLCGYCGVESLRPQVVWEARRAGVSDVRTTEHSLLDAQHACETATDDLLGTPAIIVFIFVVLPGLLYVPYLLYLAFLDYPLTVGGGLAGVALAGWIVWRLRRTA